MKFKESDETGAAPTLAIFLILILISSALVLAQLRRSEERNIDAIQLLTASDKAQSALASINSELNNALRKSTNTAMYDVGMGGGSIEEVETRIIDYLNDRIEEGWDYPNQEENIPLVNENSISFRWQPDGSLSVRVQLDTEIKHVMGPTAFGTYLQADTYPRFERIENLAHQVSDKIPENASSEEIEDLEGKLNENYKCEGIEINLSIDGSKVKIRVNDVYAGETVNL